MGISEVIKNYSKLKNILRETCNYIKENSVDLVVLIDYPGFNIRLAEFAKKNNIPVLYYIAPKLWAWGAWRIKRLSKAVNKLAVIFPFEEKYFTDGGIDTIYVGNPIAEVKYDLISKKDFLEKLNIPLDSKILGLLPGSRKNEISRLLPPMVEASKNLLDSKEFDFCLVSKFQGFDDKLLTQFIPQDNRFKLIEDNPGPIHKHSNFLIVKSGTSTTEVAFHKKPFVVVYKGGLLTYLIFAKLLMKIKEFSMVNIICQKLVVPELLQNKVTSENIYNEIMAIIHSKEKQQFIEEEFTKLHNNLSSEKPSKSVASLIKEMTNG